MAPKANTSERASTGFPVELLGRHVLQRAEQAALRRQRGAGRRPRRIVRRVRLAQPGQPEVEQLHPGGREHHVARLQVAVDDAPPVGGVERLGDVSGDAQRLVQRQRPPLEAPGERLPVEAFHDEEVDRRIRLVGCRRAARRPLAADVVQRADVGVAEGPHGARLALEALAQGGVGGHVGRQDLDGDGTIQARVRRPVHLAHAAGAEGVDYLVRPEPNTWSQCHVQGAPGRVHRTDGLNSAYHGRPARRGGHVFYFAVPPADTRFSRPHMPSYGVPGCTGWPALPPDHPGFRVRTGGRAPEDPDLSDRWIAPEYHDRPRQILERHFPDLVGAPVNETRACHYESRVDGNFIVDTHPDLDNVWLAGGGSAEAFKFGPVLGDYIAHRVLGADRQPELAEGFRLKEAEFESR